MKEKYAHKYTEWGFDTLQDVSRTFALSLGFLPSPMQTYVSTSYLLCRIPDTIEDAPWIEPSVKCNLLDEYVAVMSGERDPDLFVSSVISQVDLDKETLATKSADWRLVVETPKAIELYESFPTEITDGMRPWVIELTEGMKEFVNRYSETGGVRVQTYDEFEQYCYYVAGTVGHLLVETISSHYEQPASEEIHTAAEQYGYILQFVNIGKDVYDDYETENNVYLPIEWLNSVGVETENITDSSNKNEVGRVVTRIVERAESYYPSARMFLEWYDSVAPSDEEYGSLALPYLLAVATIRELKKNSDVAIQPEEVKITREEVLGISESVTSEPLEMIEYESKITSESFVD